MRTSLEMSRPQAKNTKTMNMGRTWLERTRVLMPSDEPSKSSSQDKTDCERLP